MGFVHEASQNAVRTWKQVTIAFVFIGLGMTHSLHGPSILDLQTMVNTSLDQISLTIPARSIGSVIGSILCGYVLEKVDHQILLVTTMSVLTSAAFAMAACTHVYHMFAVMLIQGLAIGAMVNCGNCWTLHMWGKEAGPFMQMVHFAFGFGSFFAPFFAEPFLTKAPQIAEEALIENALNHSITSNITSLDALFREPVALLDPTVSRIALQPVRIHWAYILVGTMDLILLLVCIVTYCLYPSNPMHSSRQIAINKKKNEKEASVKSTDSKPSKVMIYGLIGLGAAFIHCIYGVELSFGSFLATFAVKSNLHLQKSVGSYMTSMYWACFTFFRLFAIVLVNYISSQSMLYLSLSLIALSNFILLPLANTNEWALWVGSGLMGLGVSSVYPTLWSFLEEVIMVSGKINSVMTTAACLGEFILPVIIGNYIEEMPMCYLYILFCYGGLAFALLVCLHLWADKMKPNKANESMKECAS